MPFLITSGALASYSTPFYLYPTAHKVDEGLTPSAIAGGWYLPSYNRKIAEVSCISHLYTLMNSYIDIRARIVYDPYVYPQKAILMHRREETKRHA